ncbi:MAG: amino acid-binding protein [Planctomycetota bacterium]
MALKVKQVDVWAGTIKDRPGGLGEKLKALSAAGALLEFVISRRAPEKPGTGVVFLTPLKGAKQMAAAKKAGLKKAKSLHSVRIEGPDKAGIGAKITGSLAKACINLRGLSAAAIGKRFVAYLALDTASDAAKAIRILKKF